MMSKLSDKDIKALQINSMAQTKGWANLEADLKKELENKKKELLRLDDIDDIKRAQGEAKQIQEFINKVEYYQDKAEKIDK